MDKLPFNFVTNACGIKLITRETLKHISPDAFKRLGKVDHNETFWVMTERPELVSGTPEDDDEVWSGTNEVELAVWLSEDWDKVATEVAGMKVVLLCGSEDDECGNFWDASAKRWTNYMF